MSASILIVEDDAALRTTLRDRLRGEKYSVDVAKDAEEGMDKVNAFPFDLLIVDVMLPYRSGFDFCRELRQSGVTAPILMLTAAESESDTIEGLEAGANDYVTKPFRFAVLMARVHAHLRSHGQNEDAVYRIGPYTFRPSAKVLLDEKDKKIRLTEKETNILKFLYRSGETVPRETLLHEVWGYNPAVTTHTLETHIYRLRQKIEISPGQARILVTESGGYRLMP